MLLSSRSIVWMGNKGQVGYPSDVSDEAWAFVAPYLALCRRALGSGRAPPSHEPPSDPLDSQEDPE